MTTYPFAADAPIHVAKVGLKARDAEALSDYYKALLGFAEIRRTPEKIVLGVKDDGLELLELERAPLIQADNPRGAGLFHTAFLFPSRADLGRWVGHASANRIRIEGASDHLVSEAVYLTDPEGNGIEIYADRPKERWNWNGGSVAMATKPLDFQSLSAEPGSGDAWTASPAGTIVGHVHLRVGDPREAEAFWHDSFGFDTVAKYGSQAVFLSTGGYHHHIGANTWQSAGAGRRDPGRTGLSFVELKGKGHVEAKTANDPWGTEVRLTP